MTQTRAARFVLTASLVLIAFNMRPALTSLGPVLPEAMRDTGLNPASAGLLTTLPVLCLGLFGLTAPPLARWMGAERAVFVFMLLLAVGLAMRAAGGAPMLVLGCALGGVGIGVVNVLAPSLIKRAFPDRAAQMMGLYSMGLTGGAAIAAGAVVPIERALGGWWAGALAVWALPALIAALVWLSQLRKPEAKAAAPADPGGLWRDRLAWQVTAYMGLQSALAYSLFAWLAPMLRSRGMSALDAGLAVSVMILVSAIGAFVAPGLAARGRDQRLAAAGTIGLSMIGLAGCLFTPLPLVWAWSVVLGAGQGAAFAIALALLVMRAGDAQLAAKLSSMAQGVGYSFAALAPLLMGLLRTWTGSWTAPALLFFAVAVVAMLAGWGAGRNAQVRTRSAPKPSAA